MAMKSFGCLSPCITNHTVGTVGFNQNLIYTKSITMLTAHEHQLTTVEKITFDSSNIKTIYFEIHTKNHSVKFT